MSRVSRRAVLLTAGLSLILALPVSVSANHSWGNYHWARTSNPFTLKLGDNVTSLAWGSSLGTTSSDWSASSVLDTTIVGGQSRSAKLCNAITGTVQVCNAKYGNNGWLGLAQIWLSGLHITKGAVKVNDTYYALAKYDTPAWRNLVMCQEVGHTLGLGHQDETSSNANLDTCMDYTGDPTSNQQPNQHDYDELVTIYTHLDSTSTIASATTSGGGNGKGGVADGPADGPAAWGRLVATTNHGHGAWFVLDLGGGDQLLTHVLWADR
ncbi:MAG: hypothetical protein ABIQ17_05755 [Candidatus Limnocylindrales bacterium]